MIPIKGTLKKTDELLVVVIVTNDIQSKWNKCPFYDHSIGTFKKITIGMIEGW